MYYVTAARPTWLRAATAFAAVAALSAATPSTGEAQFLKRIKQAAADKAAEAAGQKAVEKVAGSDSTGAAAGAARAAGVPGAAPKSGDTRLEITAERIDQLIVAMKPVMELQARYAARDAAKEAVEKYEACTKAAQSGTPASLSAADQKKFDATTETTSRLSEASLKPGISDEQRAAISDSIQALSHAQMTMMYPALGKCGAKPVEPKVDDYKNPNDLPPARIAGMSPAQFGILRERVAMSILKPGAQGIELSDAESKAIAARQAELAPLVAAWRAGNANYSSWGEVYSGWERSN